MAVDLVSQVVTNGLSEQESVETPVGTTQKPTSQPAPGSSSKTPGLPSVVLGP